MVQTEQQYICIHQCLLAVLEGKENIICPPREIHDNEGYEGKSIYSSIWLLVYNIIGFMNDIDMNCLKFRSPYIFIH